MLGKCLPRGSLSRFQLLRRYQSSCKLPQCIDEIYSSPPQPNTKLTVEGWVSASRASKNVAFVDIIDGTTHQDVKCVVKPPSLVSSIKTGMCVKVDGQWSEGRGTQPYELHVGNDNMLQVVGGVEEMYPLKKKDHSDQFLRTIPEYRWRQPEAASLLRFRSKVETNLVNFFDRHSFTKTHPPETTSSDCEGAGEMFCIESLSKVGTKDPFFGKNTYLTVSTQLHLEVLCAALSRVWTLSPCFRAEESDTNRHLSEFWMLEVEIAFIDQLKQLTDFAEAMIKNVVEALVQDEGEIGSNLTKSASKERATQMIDRWNMLLQQNHWKSITYTEAIEILQEASKSGQASFKYVPSWGDSLMSEHEKWLAGEYFKNPVFVTDYPLEEKAFYMKINHSDTPGQTVACFDLLVPEVGELIGGSMREHDFAKLSTEIARRGMDVTPLEWYLSQRKNGTFPHGGFGMGFERLLQYLSCTKNIKDVIAFPRTVNNCPC